MGRYRGLRAISALAALALAAGAVLAGTVTYTYDARGRVVSATYANGLTTGYVYDAAGNRTQVATAAPPVANPVALGVIVNTTANPVPLSVSGAYTSVGVATGATHGTATSSGTSITYSPGSGYTGPDSFTYQATNSSGTSAPAGVLVAVAPAAGAVGLTVAYNSASNPVPLSITGAYASVALASFASHGAAILSGTSINYTPATGYIGGDSFLYSASNAVATSAPATVTVTVNPPPPIANPVSASVVNDTTNNHILTNITGGTPTSVAVSTPASHGTATPSGSTSYVYYTPNSGYSGPDSFAYTASNAGGTSSPATATITVTGLTAVASTTLNCPTAPRPMSASPRRPTATHSPATHFR